MSLRAIRDVRLQRQKPSMVMVVIGDLPAWMETDPGTVVVRPGDDLSRVDWRPMVGVSAAVFTICQRPDLTLTVLDALRAAGAVLVGAASDLGIFPLLQGPTEEHERLLQRAWDQLCRC